ncbi:MAG: 2-oxoacid:ferredoxin oxidoreductase subunit alpha [delta proteobacterium MLS_D]|jgi:2-oxoglutarate/2-oxoacid ferredoxin oxidoreductase subunit alpha|nr:MAG: 2-oxoacid:ferredoxin oxidoreductase subunit alpha [delta proteobacterium MLS_D]
MSAGKVRSGNDLSLLLCGEAGRGIQSVESVTTGLLKSAGFHVFSWKEFMSRVRGGSNSTTIRVASHSVEAPLGRVDLLFPFDAAALRHVRHRVTSDTILFADEDIIDTVQSPDGPVTAVVPFRKTAVELGNAVYANMVASGFIAGLFDVDFTLIGARVESLFTGPRAGLAAVNHEAARQGYDLARKIVDDGLFRSTIIPDSVVHDRAFISGAEAVGIGALAGGCNFVSSYPMSPSTAVLVFMAEKAREFECVVEQAEDEISAVNMAIGAWYAGARAMVTTSGGGFALMEEAMGLAGMIESPLVIHLAQRPGPATGLPTRTEQGDLQLALYSGHGEFPRILLAPATAREAIELSRRAFHMADRYQVPVFILTDQYLIDSYYTAIPPEIDGSPPISNIVETERDYRRYRLTPDGVSPRGIPGWGAGLVMVDSDEHDEEGHITENHQVRTAMVDKRMAKYAAMERDVLQPSLVGSEEYHTLVVSWGSTGPVVREALERLGRPGVSQLHFSQVFPLHVNTAHYLEKARRIILVEGNATSQFGRLLRAETGYRATDRILKYDGLPFTVEELERRLAALDGGEVEP